MLRAPFARRAVADAVVDASVWVSRLVPSDVNHKATVDWFERRGEEGSLLIVPAVMPPEVSGAIARRTRDRKLARRAIERLLRLPTLRIVTVDRRLAEHAASLAADLRLRGADATYVAVADRLHLPLVTWDREQRERAKEAVRTVTAT
ncbi:MAG: type II toxin-antitoxin system VapC family toxin, partial [Deltaproteobacteria bacterium]